MLALLCVVCVWFWGPLLFPKDESKSKPVKTTNSKAAMPMQTAPATSLAKPVADTAALGWKELAEKLETDRRMQVAQLTEGEKLRDPFSAVTPDHAADLELDALLAEATELGLLGDEPSTTAPTATDVDWSAVPLELSSTLVMGNYRKAVINGRAFAEGAAIGKVGDRDVKLLHVEPRTAIVSWNGVTRELRIPKAGEAPLPRTDAENENGPDLLSEPNPVDDDSETASADADRS